LTTTTTTFEENTQNHHVIDELDQTKQQLQAANERLQELEKQNGIMSKILESNEQSQQQLHIPRNELTIDLWNPTTELQKPVLIYSAATLHAIGCNQAFRDIGRYDMDVMKNRFDVITTVPPRMQEAWRRTIQWLVAAGVKYFQGHAIMKFNTDQEQSMVVFCHISRSFLWVEFEPDNNFSDEWIVNDTKLEKSFSINYDSPMPIQTPTQSFNRLILYLMGLKDKSEYSDQRASQEATLRDLYYASSKYLENFERVGNRPQQTQVVQPDYRPAIYSKVQFEDISEELNQPRQPRHYQQQQQQYQQFAPISEYHHQPPYPQMAQSPIVGGQGHYLSNKFQQTQQLIDLIDNYQSRV
jgi:hypothetical protein